MDMHQKRQRLRQLLEDQSQCTPIMGAYDVLSARIIEQTGFPVLYTGSFVTGATKGLPDVGLVQLGDLLPLAREIAKETDLPLICDADSGWYHAANIWRTVHEFESAGASAIHIEDTVFGKHTEFDPVLLDTEAMCQRIRACVDARRDSNFLIIARSDAIYLKDDPEEAVERINAYLDAGADAGFLVFKGSVSSLAKYRARIKGPVIVTSVDFQDSVDAETQAGANMSVYWPLAIFAAFKAVKQVCEAFHQGRDASKLREYCFDEGLINKTVGYERFNANIEKYGAP